MRELADLAPPVAKSQICDFREAKVDATWFIGKMLVLSRVNNSSI